MSVQIIHDPEEKVPQIDDDKILLIGDIFHGDGENVSQSHKQPSIAVTIRSIMLSLLHLLNNAIAAGPVPERLALLEPKNARHGASA